MHDYDPRPRPGYPHCGGPRLRITRVAIGAGDRAGPCTTGVGDLAGPSGCTTQLPGRRVCRRAHLPSRLLTDMCLISTVLPWWYR